MKSLARFAVESGRLTDSIVKPKLFEPTKSLELSVFRIEGIGHSEICNLGVDVANKHPTARYLYGWGELSESAVIGTGLQVEYDNVPPRHANIVNWPQDASERKERQLILASRSRPVKLDPPISARLDAGV